MRITGFDVFVVDFNGRGRLRPQSPRAKDEVDVSIAACVGCGLVAVSDSATVCDDAAWRGEGTGAGTANSRECRSRFAVGDERATAMVEVRSGGIEEVRDSSPRIWRRWTDYCRLLASPTPGASPSPQPP